MDDSISDWICGLKQGNAKAAARLWDRYFRQLEALARNRMRDFSRRAADEEDVALSVFDSLCRGAARGKYPLLSDRDNLWALLLVMTERKVCDYRDLERAQKRGGGQIRVASEIGDGSSALALDGILSREPTPEVAAMMAEACDRLLKRLDDAQLQKIALSKMEGYSNQELAEQLHCGLRTIERKLELIRQIWTDESVSKRDS